MHLRPPRRLWCRRRCEPYGPQRLESKIVLGEEVYRDRWRASNAVQACKATCSAASNRARVSVIGARAPCNPPTDCGKRGLEVHPRPLYSAFRMRSAQQLVGLEGFRMLFRNLPRFRSGAWAEHLLRPMTGEAPQETLRWSPRYWCPSPVRHTPCTAGGADGDSAQLGE